MVRDDGHDPKAVPGSAATYLCLGPGWSNMCNTPFRRHKTWVHEGGSCTPFIAHWPDGIEARGELRHAHGHVIDIVPTILDLAGIPPDSLRQVSLPGLSLRPLFEKETDWQRYTWWYHEGNKAVRAGHWKLVAAKDEPWELFYLEEDRTESRNLAETYPDKVLELEKQWKDILGEICEVALQKSTEDKDVPVTTENLE